jgi:hypothetical protein
LELADFDEVGLPGCADCAAWMLLGVIVPAQANTCDAMRPTHELGVDCGAWERVRKTY